MLLEPVFLKSGQSFFSSLSGESLTLLTFVLCNGALLLLFRFFGLGGILTYSTVAIIVSNLQVLKVAVFSFLSEPVAMGTVVFTSLYFSSDMITEFYGSGKARQVVHLNFIALVLTGGLMMITLGHPPLLSSTRDLQVYRAIETLFSPIPSLIAASFLAYLVSQYSDIWIFSKIRQITGPHLLWLRVTLSTLISGFLDTLIFSVLAWVVFAPYPMSWNTLIWTYILGTFWLRGLISLLHTPLMYLAQKFSPSS